MRRKNLQTGLIILFILLIGGCSGLLITWVSQSIIGLEREWAILIGGLPTLFLWGFIGVVIIVRRDVTIFYIPGVINFRITGIWAILLGLIFPCLFWGMIILVLIKMFSYLFL